MKRLKNSIMALGVLFSALCASTPANSSLLIEPHIGYNLSSSTTINTIVSKYSGVQYGARLGAQYFGVMGGFAYNHSTYKLKTTIPSLAITDEPTDSKKDDLGIFVGYSAPILLRAWIGYYFSSKQTATSTSTLYTTGDYLSGKTTEFGVGFTGLPFLSLNLVYRMVTLDKSYDVATGVTSDQDPKFSPKEIVLGVSFPFTLL
jgi:hypothetical protein